MKKIKLPNTGELPGNQLGKTSERDRKQDRNLPEKAPLIGDKMLLPMPAYIVLFGELFLPLFLWP